MAIDVLGHRARSAILRALVQHGPLTTPAAAQLIGVRRQVAWRYLTTLEEAGFVHSDAGAGSTEPRSGETITWTADSAAIESALQSWTDYLLDRDAQK